MIEDIANIKRIQVLCKKCKSELTFNIEAHSEYNGVYNCPLCGGVYGFDPEDNAIQRAKQLIAGTKQAKGAVVSFVCEEEG